MNINRLNQMFENSKLSKVEFAKRCGITRATLDNALQGGDIRVSILEKIASVLDIPVGTLFDDPPSLSLIGDNNQVNGHGAHGNINGGTTVDVAVLEERIKAMQQLLQEKERTIKILMEK